MPGRYSTLYHLEHWCKIFSLFISPIYAKFSTQLLFYLVYFHLYNNICKANAEIRESACSTSRNHFHLSDFRTLPRLDFCDEDLHPCTVSFELLGLVPSVEHSSCVWSPSIFCSVESSFSFFVIRSMSSIISFVLSIFLWPSIQKSHNSFIVTNSPFDNSII